METYGNLAESGNVAGHSYDSGLENCEFAEEKWSGAGEGNRTLVFVEKGEIIEKICKMRDLSASRGAICMTLYDNQPTHFFSAAIEFHSDSKAVLSAYTESRGARSG